MSGTYYRGTQGGGTNNHRTLKTPKWTRAPLRFLPERWEFGSASPDARRLAPPHPTAGGRLRLARPLRYKLCLARPPRAGLDLAQRIKARLRLARCPKAGSASPDNRTPLPHDDRHRVRQDVWVNHGTKRPCPACGRTS